jgi:3-phosphoshikimate 1-carboxyvinyltransferase
MKVNIHPSKINGIITAPASKSSMQRACAAALVRKGESIIYNPGKSNDDKAALGVIKALGATIEQSENGSIKINSSKFLSGNEIYTLREAEPAMTINNGESGLGIRMFTPLVALSKKEITINGEGSLLTRPMDFFDEIFPQVGVQVISNNGKLPLKVKGPLQPKNITIDGSLSSQFLTGLLLAYSALDAKDVTITVTNLKSKPYIDLTLKVMKDFGLKLPQNMDYKEFYFDESTAGSQPSPVNYTVEGDWSGGSFLLVAGAIAAGIVVKGLDINSTQADKKIIEALKDSGCNFSVSGNEISFSASHADKLSAFKFNATDCPDLFPPLAVLAAYCKGITYIKGVNRLTHKESNRALTIQEELGKMGVKIILDDDVMQIHGGAGFRGTQVCSHHDHRIAMMCAIAALRAQGETVIEDADAVNKSYPDFWDDISKLNASISY